MTAIVSHVSRSNKLQSFGYVAIGSLVAVLGTVGLLLQLLSPLSLLGSVNYMTVGSLLAVSHSSELQRTFYNMLPAPLKRFLFERTLLQLFEDRSRYLQITAYLIACLTLPEDQVAKLRADLPSTFDHCRQKGVLGSCVSFFDSTSSSGKHTEDGAPYIMPETHRDPVKDPFLKKFARAAVDSACGDAMRAAGELCTQGAVGMGRRLQQLAQSSWVPTTACVLCSSSLCFWLLDVLGRGASYEKLLWTSARYLMRSCSGYMRTAYALQRDSARAMSAVTWDASSAMTVLAIAGSTVTAVSAGGWLLCGEKSNDLAEGAAQCRIENNLPDRSTPCAAPLPTATSCATAPAPAELQGAQEVCSTYEKKACAVLVILAIMEMSALFRPVHPLVHSLRKLQRQALTAGTAGMTALQAKSASAQEEERAVLVVKLCQVLVMVYAHRMRCTAAQARWLLPVLYAQVSKRLASSCPSTSS